MSSSPLDRVYDEVSKCNRCGFCQSACPVYRVTGRESSTARGHSYQVRSVLEGRLESSSGLSQPLFECLLCRACLPQCSPRVQTDRVVVAGRQALAGKKGCPGLLPFAFRRLLLNPRRLSRYASLLSVMKRTGVSRMAALAGGGPARAEGLLTQVPRQSLQERVKSICLAPPSPKGRVAYFVGCGSNYLLPEVGEATIRVLVASGYAVEVTRNYCCGLPPYTYGDVATARRLAKGNLRLLDYQGVDAIVTDCASCSSFLKSYPQLLREDGAFAGSAEQMAKKVLDITEWLSHPGLREGDQAGPALPYGTPQGAAVYPARKGGICSAGACPPLGQGGGGQAPALQDEGGQIPALQGERGQVPALQDKRAELRRMGHAGAVARPELPLTVTYHDPCHASRYQGLREEPRSLLRSVPGVNLLEMEEADWCCGGAGTYSVTHPDLAQRILDRKIDNVERTGAQALVTSCPSCMIHLSYGVRRRGLAVQVLHLTQVLEMACLGRS